MSTPKCIAEFIVYGEPASKANSRQIVRNRRTGKPMSIKSKKALGYVADFALQCPQINPVATEDVRVTLTIHYASRRPDLDESIILDCMQGYIYKNDRQVKEKHVYWALDRDNPRTEIKVELL